MPISHFLFYSGTLPLRFNNPFYYEPDAVSRKAVDELVAWLYGKPSHFSSTPVDKAFREEIDKGKMLGVLVVKRTDNQTDNNQTDNNQTDSLFYLAGYSGQIGGRSDWPDFVPAVFDYLQPDGYFKRKEREIEASPQPSPKGEGDHAGSTSIGELPPPLSGRAGEGLVGLEGQERPEGLKGRCLGESEEAYIRRRQFENAELHRWKLRERERLAKIEAARKAEEEKLMALKKLRRQKSYDLQCWLFRHFVMRNGKGEDKNLLEITASSHPAPPQPSPKGEGDHADSTSNGAILPPLSGRGGVGLPPAGSGECCEPKMLQYALTHGLKPVSMAMFWWGESPKKEIRHHLQFYPACNSKCKPILKWMLQGIDVMPNPLESKERDEALARQLKIIYEDEAVCVIVKPAGLLSVPGKNGRTSVQSIMRQRYPDSDSPLIVHRLDMDTSGLMVIAKTTAAYHDIQQQFARHEVRKRYVAILEKSKGIASPSPTGEGRGGAFILPLSPDLTDRPRQMVDFEHGREAVTEYRFVSSNRVWLWPLTGRTHQLRVHCAHRLGLNNPIKGDPLYGQRADRLYLHAEEITFLHPSDHRKMHFLSKAPF